MWLKGLQLVTSTVVKLEAGMVEAKKEEDQFSLIDYIRQTAKDDVRLFLAPFVGAVKGIKDELDRIDARKRAERRKARQE
jgi:hypothetical protein